jgi:tetratricopeptide (TPR) repeat protein
MKDYNFIGPASKQIEMIEGAVALHHSGQLDLAEIQYKKLLNFFPDNAIILTKLGTIAFQRGRLEDGVRTIGKSLNIDPNQPNALNNSGVALRKIRRPNEALAHFDRAISLKPDYPVAHLNRGNVLRDLNRLDEALVSYYCVIALNPDDADAYLNRGIALKDLKRFDEALEILDYTLKLNYNYSVAHLNRGNILRDLNRMDEALASYDRATALNPDYADAYSNRGNVLKDFKRVDEASKSFDYAIVLKPDFSIFYWNKSLLKLLIGEYLEGWKLYQCKINKEIINSNHRDYNQPLWLGVDFLINKTLLIYSDQGFGDYIQFVRYAAMVEQLGAKVILEVPSELMTLFSSLKGKFILIEKGTPLPNFDYHCPVTTLPFAFKTTVETIPAQMPYLYAGEKRKKRWNEKLGIKTVRRIGLVWSGSDAHKNDDKRSLLLKELIKILNIPAEFYCLQKEIRKIDIRSLMDFPNIRQHQEHLLDFSDTAALIDAMDLVISVDTSVAHLAGAMGKKTFILLPYSPDYRWMLEKKDSPWYPTVTLFRQPAMGDWDTVISEVTQSLSC